MKAMILNNESVDSAILAVLGAQPKRAGVIQDETKIHHRAIDSGLQRLRRAGKIRLVTGPGGGWVLS